MKYRKNANRTARAGCHFCKPWKLRLMSRESKDFERHSDHVRRLSAKDGEE